MNITDNSNNKPICYSAYSKDMVARMKSSSGGIFFELAKAVFAQNGVVVGAAVGNDGEVESRAIEKIEEIDCLLGSKYVQNNTKDIFVYVLKLLKDKRIVAFCSTPCQCNALIKFFGGKRPEGLLLIDFICHGVPSEMVWKKYLSHITKGNELKDVSFRDKRIDWGNFGMKISTNEVEYFSKHQDDPYMKLFLGNRILRPSCYKCRSKGENRFSDITLGDFWGIEMTTKEPLSFWLEQRLENSILTGLPRIWLFRNYPTKKLSTKM